MLQGILREQSSTRARCGSRSPSTISRAGAADESTRRVLEQALQQAQGAHPHRRLRHRRVAAAAAAPLPGDAIKVSRALVAGIGHDAGAFEIVRAVVGLAHNLGLEVIAEGVETARAARLPQGARLRVRAGLPHLGPAERLRGGGAPGDRGPEPLR